MSLSEIYDLNARAAIEGMQATSVSIDRRFKSSIRKIVIAFALGVIPLLIAFAALAITP